MAPSSIGEERKAVGWNRVRLSVVVPIGVIVAVAIVCVVVAVLGSAQRADEVALEPSASCSPGRLPTTASACCARSRASPPRSAPSARIRAQYDADWVQRRVGRWLETYFDHDFVFVADASDRLIYALLGHRSVDPNWFNTIRPDVTPVIDLLRGRAGSRPAMPRATRTQPASRRPGAAVPRPPRHRRGGGGHLARRQDRSPRTNRRRSC